MRRIAILFAMAGSTLLMGVVGAQTDGSLSVRVGPDQLITASLPSRPLVEPHLATNPRNAQHLVGAALLSVQDRADLLEGRCVALASFDGGRTWVAHQFDFQRCYDPWVAILDDGTAIFVGLETTNEGAVTHLWLFRSADGGRTWSTPPQSFGRGHDHPTLIVDRSGGRFHGALYVASVRVVRDEQGKQRTKQFVARSMDGGKTLALIAEHETTNLTSTTLTAAVLPGGALMLPVHTFRRYVDNNRTASLQRRLIWAIRSEDGGASFGPPMLISDGCDGPVGFPSVAVDLSDRGRAYFVCHDGLRSGPYVMRSDDGGDRWSDPLHVPKTLPSDASGQRQTTTMAVNREGVLAVSWHDRGPDASRACWDVFVAFSGDGGQIFTASHKVSTQPSCPAAGDNGYAAETFPFGGHYSGLAAAADGSFHLLWADSRGPRYELRTAQVRVTR
jgi:hypothetical protein